MSSRYEHYWQPPRVSLRLSRAMIISIALHLLAALAIYHVAMVYSGALPNTIRVRLIPYPKGETQKQEVPGDAESGLGEGAKAAPKPEPKPEPPPEPKPEVKPEPPPEPKAVPKPEPEPRPKPEVKKPEPKPEPKKPEAKKPEAKKPEPKKPEPKKPEPKKPNAKDGKAPKGEDDPNTFRMSPKSNTKGSPGSVAGDANGNDKYVHEAGIMTPGINLPEGTPTVLDGWAKTVQNKVERIWQPPAGVILSGAEDKALVSFWVDREGNLIGKPEIIKHASDQQLGESGLRAILEAVPLPPLPEAFTGMEQQVIYAFTLR